MIDADTAGPHLSIEVLPMALLRSFVSYYIRNAIPFATGLAFAVLALRVDYAWYWLALAGIALVVIGPLTIQFVLTLVVEALRGLPSEHGERREGRSGRVTTSSLTRFHGLRIGSRGR